MSEKLSELVADFTVKSSGLSAEAADVTSRREREDEVIHRCMGTIGTGVGWPLGIDIPDDLGVVARRQPASQPIAFSSVDAIFRHADGQSFSRNESLPPPAVAGCPFGTHSGPPK